VRPLLKRNARKDIQLPVATGCAGLQRYLSLAQAVDMISIINEHQQLRDHPAELIVALGKEGKENVAIDPKKRPLCAATGERFKSTATQEAYRRRNWLSEPPNDWVKHVLGFRQFSMRGLTKAQAEWRLVCAALNLRRMANMMAA